MKSIIVSLVTSILTTIYQSFFCCLLLSVMGMFFWLYAKDASAAGKGYRQAVKKWIQTFRAKGDFRAFFFWVLYTSMVLFRTFCLRNITANPFINILGGWWIRYVDIGNGQSKLSTDCFENLIMLLPYMLLLLNYLRQSNYLSTFGFNRIVKIGISVSFMTSLYIEMTQVFLRIGTFQISDLVYNTLGGAIGSVIYYLFLKKKERSAGPSEISHA